MTTTEAWTIGRLLTWTADYLSKHGSSSPRLDGEILLAHVLECERIQLYTAFDTEPDEEVKAAFKDMIRRRAEGMPVAYLVGYKEFYSATFEVNSDVLIPRPETEHLVVEAIDRAKQLIAERGANTCEVVDLGTGSGAIAVTVALHVPGAQVTAIDNSPTALEVARKNIARHGVDERVVTCESDLFAEIPAETQYDLILSNPPYVSEAEFAELDTTVKDFEPRQALVAGPTGMEIIDRLLLQASQRLRPDGSVILELSPMLAPRLTEQLADCWQPPTVLKDLAGHARIACLQLRG